MYFRIPFTVAPAFTVLGLTMPSLLAASEAAPDAMKGIFWGTGAGFATMQDEYQGIADFLEAQPQEAAINDDETVFKGFVGYDFTPYFAAEMFYAYLGRVRFDESAGTSSDLESSAYGMSAVGQLPLASWLTAFAKAGVAKWDTSLEGNLNGTRFEQQEGQDGTDPVYGIGAQFNFSPLLLRTEYEYYDFDDNYGVDTFTASVGFRF